VIQLDFWRGVFLGDLKQVTLAPGIMAFTIKIFTRRLAALFPKLFLLLPDPGQLGDGKLGWC
jgi:hypothetical protein